MSAETSAPTAAPSGVALEERLPRRDFIILPLISLATIAGLFVATEIGTRLLWPESGLSDCFVTDSVEGLREKPNCEERLKNAEGPWVTYHYNECGNRTYASCGPKPPGAIRIALIGSSTSLGLEIPFEQTFAERAARELSRLMAARSTCRTWESPLSHFSI